MSRKRILIFGTGGVGSIYAYILSRSPAASVTVICRSNYTAVKEHGISIDSDIFGQVSFRPETVVSSVAEAAAGAITAATGDQTERNSKAAAEAAESGYDYILVTTKSFPGTAPLIREAVTPGKTSIVLAQNGIGIEDEYATLYPETNIISGVVYLPTTQTSPGVVRMGPLQELHIGAFPASRSTSSSSSSGGSETQIPQDVQDFAALFSAGGGDIKTYPDVQAQRWIKLIANAPWNPICALTRLDDGNLLRSSPLAEPVIRGVIAEVAAVAASAGYSLGREVIEAQIARPKKRMETGGKEPSMLTDVREGRRLEVEAIVGNLCRIARRNGVETTRLDMLYVLASGLSYSLVPDERFLALGM